MRESPEDEKETKEIELKKEKTETPLQRWRRIARRVGKQKNWTKGCIIKVLTDSGGDPLHGTNLERIPFNANAFKANVQFGHLSVRAKHLFTKDPDVRTDEDITDLYRVVDKLQCFNKYSSAVKQGLAKFVYYSQFQADRVVVQQGRPALSFYFILRGSVNVCIEDRNRITGRRTKNIVGEILAGDSFGELALLHNTKRRATIICKEDTEFLRLDKSDFNQVLRETYQKEWDDRMSHLQAMSAFRDWPMKELRAANTASKLVDYPDNTLVLKDENGPPEFVYLIKSGNCTLVKEMDLIKRWLPFGRTKFILPPEKSNTNEPRLKRLKQNETSVKFYLTVRTLKQGDYFGIGQDMKNSFIITKGKAELMLIPRNMLTMYNRGKVLQIMKDELPENEWTREDIFKAFLQTCSWDNYKKQLVKDVVRNRASLTSTQLRDVPASIRTENSTYHSYQNTLRSKEMKFQSHGQKGMGYFKR